MGGVTPEPDLIRETVRQAFEATLARVVAEVELMPLERWNESVFRHAFCQGVAEARPELHQFVESDRIDLVLRTNDAAAFIEFKFYLRRRRIGAYTGQTCGYRGGPSAQNLREFRSCIDRLYERPSVPGLSKFVVLFYSDPAAGGPPVGGRFADYLDDYQHPDGAVPLHVVQTQTAVTDAGDNVRATLFELIEDPTNNTSVSCAPP